MIVPEPFFTPRGTPFSVRGRLKALSALGHHVDVVTYHIGNDISLPNIQIYRTPWIPWILINKNLSGSPALWRGAHQAEQRQI